MYGEVLVFVRSCMFFSFLLHAIYQLATNHAININQVSGLVNALPSSIFPPPLSDHDCDADLDPVFRSRHSQTRNGPSLFGFSPQNKLLIKCDKYCYVLKCTWVAGKSFQSKIFQTAFQRTCEELLSKSVDYKIPLHYIPSCLIPFHSILFHFTFPFSSMAFHSISFQSMACFSIPFCSIPQVSSMAFFSIPSHSLAYFFQSIPFHH